MNNVGLNFRGIEQPTINTEKNVDEKPIEKPIEEDVKPQEFSKEASDLTLKSDKADNSEYPYSSF